MVLKFTIKKLKSNIVQTSPKKKYNYKRKYNIQMGKNTEELKKLCLF